MANEIVVQESFPDPRPTTNPYIVMLAEALAATDGVRLQTFSWRRALLTRYDVFHAHWPEILVSGRTPLKQLARQLLFAALLVRLRVRRTPIVRTQHNLELPSGITRRERALLLAFDRATTMRIALNRDESAQGLGPVVTIPHGHYRDWYGRFPAAAAVPGRFGYFGLIRRYKNVEALLQAFRGLEGDYSLRVAGKPSDDALATALTGLAAGDERIELTLDFLSDEELVQVGTGSELIVLPYRHMHNSGGVLAALSLDRAVLVPANAANALLAAEVGPDWVLQYEGELTPEGLAQAMESIRSRTSQRPDLSARDWSDAGIRHADAYREAIRIRRSVS